MAQWKQENERLALELGDRVFKKDYDLMFSAVMIACLSANLEVVRAERTFGFLLAEGRAPLSDEEAAPLNRKRMEDMDRCCWRVRTQRAQPAADMGLYRLAITIARRGKPGIGVSLRLTSASPRELGGLASREEGYPPIIEAIYKKMWQHIDRRVFIQENLVHRHLLFVPDPNSL